LTSFVQKREGDAMDRGPVMDMRVQLERKETPQEAVLSIR